VLRRQPMVKSDMPGLKIRGQNFKKAERPVLQGAQL
jgi:hypothetical protein